MKTIQSIILKFSVTILFIFSTLAVSNARELNTESFSGTINTTLSSGFTMRVSDRDCDLNTGYTHTSVVTAWGTVTSGNGEGCAAYRTDGFGNTSSELIAIAGSNPNGDDGSLNYASGDIVSATQKFYTEIIGDTNGFGINLSLTGSYNPVNDINTPDFKKLKAKALKETEQDLSLLNAYITTEFEAGDNYVDATIGRSVVSWGEATFIPITMNGLVTNALDLSKLRSPGASIKEALIPVEQIVLSTSVDGLGVEAYYQFQSSVVELEAAGTFYGSEVVGVGETGLVVGGAFSFERQGSAACPYELTVGASSNCTAAIRDTAMNSTTQAYTADRYLDTAFQTTTALGQTGVGIGLGTAGTKTWGDATIALNITYGSGKFGDAYAGLTTQSTAGSALYTAGQAGVVAALERVGARTARPQDRVAGLQLSVAADGKYKEARDDGQFGLKFSTFIDEAGGLDLSFFYSNYHSKTPYLRLKGAQGLYAGDLLGLFTAAAYDSQDSGYSALAAFKSGGAYDGAFTGNAFGQNIIKAIREVAYGSATCSAIIGKAGAAVYSGGATGTALTTTVMERNAFTNAYWSTEIAGERGKQWDPNKCYTSASAFNTTADSRHATYYSALGSTSATDKTGGAADVHLALMATGAHILAAITPVNYMEYDFIFPEDNQIFGSSFSTVIDGTVVQGELTFRPDFPLSTSGSSQVNQMLDASGTTQVLNWLAYNGLNAAASSASSATTTADGIQLTLAAQIAAAGGSATHTTTLRDFKRSSLAAISEATVNAGDYYSTPYLNYDVWAADIGTTTAFNASHPVTIGFGADSVVFLTEVGMVHIPNLDNAKGFVARGGFSESGDAAAKCLGAFGTSYVNTATKGVDSLGAGRVDGLFGNGGYCEDNPGAGTTSLTYRVIGSATYNNFANSSWAVKPNFAWSHDPYGYGPSSLGGFVEGRMSLSLGVSASNGAVSTSLSLVNQLGDAKSNSSLDKDTLSASVSYAF